MRLLFTNKISHHDYLFHYFLHVNIQGLIFFKENGAMKIAFVESSSWIMFQHFKGINVMLWKRKGTIIEEATVPYVYLLGWLSLLFMRIFPQHCFMCWNLSGSEPSKLEMPLSIFLSHWKSKPGITKRHKINVIRKQFIQLISITFSYKKTDGLRDQVIHSPQ